MAQSSIAAQTIARSVSESAIATQEITRSIVGVDQEAKQAAQGATKTQVTGRELFRVAEQHQTAVGQFKVQTKALRFVVPAPSFLGGGSFRTPLSVA